MGKTFIIKYESNNKCESCNKDMVPDDIPINSGWGTEPQIAKQGGTVRSQVHNGVCTVCSSKGEGKFTCNTCYKSKPNGELKMKYVEEYSVDTEKMCVDCFQKLGGEKLAKRIFLNGLDIEWLKTGEV